MTRDSDIDILVVERNPGDKRRKSVKIDETLSGLGYPFDIIVISTDWFEVTKNIVGGIAFPANKYGGILYKIEFPQTHSIRELLNLAETVDNDLATKLKAASALTPYGVDVRYPGDIPEPTMRETEDALGLARMVCDTVMGRIDKSL